MAQLARTVALAAALAAGCASAPEPEVTRVVGGERRQQTFVSPYAYEWYIRAELAVRKGDLQRAAEAFRRARTGPRDDPYVIARLGDVLDRLGHRDRAEAVLDEGLALDPHSEAVWLARARIAERHGQVDEALAAYHRAEQSAPRSPHAPLALARMLREDGQPGRAEAVLRRHLQRVDGAAPGALRARLELALVREDPRGAVEAARQLMRVAPARAELLHRTAELALDHGDAGMAVALLEVLPASRIPRPLHIRALIASGQRDRAEAVLAASSPDELGGLARQAALYLRAGRPDRAEEVAELAISLDAQPAAYLAAGRAELAQGKWEEAATHLARVPPTASVAREARDALGEALRAAALPHLADELDSSAP